MARIRLPELMADAGISEMQMAEILWPDAGTQTRRVLIARWLNRPVISIRLDQLQLLHERFPNAKLIDYEKVF